MRSATIDCSMSQAEPASELERRVIALQGGDLPEVTVVIRRSRRARHVRLHVDESGAIAASVPQRFAAQRLDAIVLERAEWLREVLTRMDLASQSTEIDLRRGDPIRLLGRWHQTELVEGGRGSCALVEERLVLTVPADTDPYDVLQRWYRNEARRVIGGRVATWATEFGLEFGAIAIRDQRTRWGSCTHRGDLSFNWRLLLAPAWVLDAIVVHELCHIDELNHSSRFWALLDERYSQHIAASDWLQVHGSALRISRPRPREDDGLPPVRPRRGRRISDLQNSMF